MLYYYKLKKNKILRDEEGAERSRLILEQTRNQNLVKYIIFKF
jgi:hypothetical protein